MVLAICLFWSCSEDDTNDNDGSDSITPVYVTVTGHIEDGSYYAECERYPEFRRKLLEFAEMIYGYEIPFNLQIDYEYFIGALNCECPEMMTETDGMNSLDYIANTFDFRIDAHQGGGWEEGSENYADVRCIGEQVVPSITDNVGGIVWDQAAQFDRFNFGEAGIRNPSFRWYPEILTMGVHTMHHLGDFSQDDLTSGIWKPADFGGEFLVHDPENRMIYIAPGGHHTDWGETHTWPFASVADYVEVLADYIDNGQAPSGKLYTATIAVPQSVIFDVSEQEKLTEQFDKLQPLVDEGKVIFAHFREIAEIWQEDFGEEPNIFTFDNIDSTDYRP